VPSSVRTQRYCLRLWRERHGRLHRGPRRPGRVHPLSRGFWISTLDPFPVMSSFIRDAPIVAPLARPSDIASIPQASQAGEVHAIVRRQIRVAALHASLRFPAWAA
jgi:hypothetical protein